MRGKNTDGELAGQERSGPVAEGKSEVRRPAAGQRRPAFAGDSAEGSIPARPGRIVHPVATAGRSFTGAAPFRPAARGGVPMRRTVLLLLICVLLLSCTPRSREEPAVARVARLGGEVERDASQA